MCVRWHSKLLFEQIQKFTSKHGTHNIIIALDEKKRRRKIKCKFFLVGSNTLCKLHWWEHVQCKKMKASNTEENGWIGRNHMESYGLISDSVEANEPAAPAFNSFAILCTIIEIMIIFVVFCSSGRRICMSAVFFFFLLLHLLFRTFVFTTWFHSSNIFFPFKLNLTEKNQQLWKTAHKIYMYRRMDATNDNNDWWQLNGWHRTVNHILNMPMHNEMKWNHLPWNKNSSSTIDWDKAWLLSLLSFCFYFLQWGDRTTIIVWISSFWILYYGIIWIE